MFAKLGPHVLASTSLAMDWARAAPIVKQLDVTNALSAAPPGAITIFRKYYKFQDINRNGADVANEILAALGGFRPSYAELFNEWAQRLGNGLERHVEFTREAVDVLHRAGVAVAGFSFSTGQPEGGFVPNFSGPDDWLYLRDQGFAGVDAIALHEYWGCVSPETRVLTADLQWVPAGQLRAGDELLGFDEYPTLRGKTPRRHYRLSLVVHNEPRIADCCNVVFESGERLTCTLDHPLLVWALRRSINKGRYNWLTPEQISNSLVDKRRKSLPQVPRLFNPWAPRDNYASGFLAAAFDAEGSLSLKHEGSPCISFGQKPNVFIQQVVNYLDTEGYSFSTPKMGRNGILQFYVNGGKAGIFSFLGMTRPPRLLERWTGFLKSYESGSGLAANEYLGIAAIEYVGRREVAGLGTSTRTYITEGFGSHNTNVNSLWNPLRHRQVHSWLGGAHPPFVITECGRDAVEGGQPGWLRCGISAEQYLQELMAYDAAIQQDSYVIGGTPFTAGAAGGEWKYFDVDTLVPAILGTRPIAEPIRLSGWLMLGALAFAAGSVMMLLNTLRPYDILELQEGEPVPPGYVEV